MGYDIERIRKIYSFTKDIKKTTDFYNKERSRKNRISQRKVFQVIEGGRYKSKLPFGIRYFSIFIITTSIIQLGIILSQWGPYAVRYGYLPGWLLLGRYSASAFQRIVALTAAIGLLYRKEIYRKVFIILGILIMVTVPWKHPYSDVLDTKLTAVKEKLISSTELKTLKDPHMTFLNLTAISMATMWLCEIFFWFIILKYLTSRKIREIYKE